MIRRSPPLPCLAIACLVALAPGVRTAGGAASPLSPGAEMRPAEIRDLPAMEPSAQDASATPPASAAPAAGGAPATATTSESGRVIAFATELGERREFARAEGALRHVLESPAAGEEDTKEALLALAQVHRREGALTKAAAIYERYLKEYPADGHVPAALLELGRTLRELGATRLALTRFYSVINSTLKLPAGDFARYQALAKTAQYEIAETHFDAGDFAEAAKFYGRLALLELAPNDAARVQFRTACAERLQGELGHAVVALRSFIEKYPDDENVPEARHLLAVTLQDLNRPQEAFSATLDLLQIAKSSSVQHPKRWAYWQRRTGNQLANYFFEAGDILNAQAIYAGLRDLSTEPAWLLPTTYQLGLCFERLGQADRARSAYQSVIAVDTANPVPELGELVRMALWRLEHLGWRERTTEKVSSLFNANAGKHTSRGTSPAAIPSDHAPVTSPPGT